MIKVAAVVAKIKTASTAYRIMINVTSARRLMAKPALGTVPSVSKIIARTVSKITQNAVFVRQAMELILKGSALLVLAKTVSTVELITTNADCVNQVSEGIPAVRARQAASSAKLPIYQSVISVTRGTNWILLRINAQKGASKSKKH
jgi:hypothetical protein